MAQENAVAQGNVKGRRTRRKTSDKSPETHEIKIGDRTVQVTQETVPTGLVPLPKFLRRFAGIE